MHIDCEIIKKIQKMIKNLNLDSHFYIRVTLIYLHYTKTNQESKAKCHLKNNLCTHTKRLKIEKYSNFDENNLYLEHLLM
jgi:hypothetical protein